MSDIPSYVPELALTTTSAAVTYHFHGTRGWALCTVNDTTGELTVQSDWGAWSHRWHTSPTSLGAPTLTAFIARIDDDPSYLADKLTSRHGGEKPSRERFDPAATLAEVRKMICARRREANESPRIARSFTAAVARDLWNDLDQLSEITDPTHFAAVLYETDNFHQISEDFDGVLVYVSAQNYLVLRHGILPKLVAACRAAVARQGAPHAP